MVDFITSVQAPLNDSDEGTCSPWVLFGCLVTLIFAALRIV